jgi:hypothetical protein
MRRKNVLGQIDPNGNNGHDFVRQLRKDAS